MSFNGTIFILMSFLDFIKSITIKMSLQDLYLIIYKLKGITVIIKKIVCIIGPEYELMS